MVKKQIIEVQGSWFCFENFWF